MSQFAVSIVIPVWNQWQFTKACLETLRPTLGVRDEVIVVDNGSEDATAKGLTQFPWVKVITNETNRGFAAACNQGGVAATGDIVVFLNNDTLLPARWLDGLVWPFEDSSVAATGPRSNFVSGEQLVENIPYATGSMAELRRFAKQWREDHRGETTECTRLVGFCLAVRRESFNEIGGFDEGFGIGGAEDDDICLRLIANGGRLLICHESFVHHHGHATFDGNNIDWFAIQQDNVERFRAKHSGAPIPKRQVTGPLVSACMIIKDEKDNLPSCLASLNGVVDEVIIYDTGSTDGSIELARASGATVIEGYWDDDFSRARNAALANCKGEWAMHIDADETFEGDPIRLRDTLQASAANVFLVEILNLSGRGKNDLTHRPARLFKRKSYQWVGRLHEQLTTVSGLPPTDFGVAPYIRLIHTGYMQEAMTAKNKAERNIRIAQLDADLNEDRDPVDKLSNLGRSYTLAGRNEEALALYTQARSLETDSEVIKRTLYRAGVQACFAVGRPGEALEWAKDLGSVSHRQDTSLYFQGLALCDLNRWEEAIEVLEGLDKMVDDDGVVFPQHIVHIKLAHAYTATERYEDAADEITIVATEENHDEVIWALLAELYWRTGRDIDELMHRIPAKHVNAVLAQIQTAPAAAADTVLESLYGFEDRRSSVLALSIRVAPHASVERALEWSSRLRQHNLSEHCPLIAKAFDAEVPTSERLRAAATACVAFDDSRAVGAVQLIAPTYEASEFPIALAELNQLAPSLLEPFIIGASIDAERGFEMAKALHGLGAADEAVAVLMHGLGQQNGERVADDAAAWLDSIGQGEAAASIRAISAQ